MSILNENNFFFENNYIIDINIRLSKEKLNYEENNERNNSISSNSTFENDFLSDEEIDFNQDFFPKDKSIKFTDCLVDNWEFKIKMYMSKINMQLSKIKI